MRTRSIIAAIALALTAGLAQADDNLYLVLGAGASDATNAFSAEAGVGWRFSDVLSVEGQLSNYGEIRERVPAQACYLKNPDDFIPTLCYPTTITKSEQVTGIGAVGRVRLWESDGWAVHASAGGFFGDKTSPLFGISFGRGILALEYRYLHKAGTATGETGLNALMINARF